MCGRGPGGVEWPSASASTAASRRGGDGDTHHQRRPADRVREAPRRRTDRGLPGRTGVVPPTPSLGADILYRAATPFTPLPHPALVGDGRETAMVMTSTSNSTARSTVGSEH